MINIFDVTDKVVCIAGGSRGLGKAIAEAYLDAGAKVILGSWDEKELLATVTELRKKSQFVDGITMNVSNRKDCEKLVVFTVSTYGKLDVMICNAGIDIIKPAEEYDEVEWDQILDVNLKGAFFCAQHASLHMLDRGNGSIILTSSIAGTHGVPGLTPYAASKGGMNMIVKTMATEWATRGVRINAVAPGYVDNIMAGVDGDSESEYQKRAMQRTPMGRRGMLNEFVGAYIFLGSDAASYVTGSTIYVDGGYHAA